MCNGSFPVGGASRRPATIHSRQPPRSSAKNGLIFRESNVLVSEQPSDREGKTDFYSPLTYALGLLGGTQSEEGPEIGLSCPLPEAAPMKQTNKAPAFLSKEKVKMVHEPNEGEGCIPIDMSKEKSLQGQIPETRTEMGRGVVW